MMRVFYCLAGIVMCGVVPAAAHAPLQPLDIFAIEVALDPRISPSCERVVYVRQTPDIMADKRFTSLWMVDANGGNHRPLTAQKRNDSQPRWSPSGDRIAYVAVGQDGQSEIRMQKIDTGEETLVAVLPEGPSGLAWSPDGAQLAYVMLKKGEMPKIADMPAPPEGAAWAPSAHVTQQFVYRFDGQGYLDPGSLYLYVVPSDGGAPREIGEVSPPDSHESVFFDWSPSGDSIIFSALRDDIRLDRPKDISIYEIVLATGDIRRLAYYEGPAEGPKVSPDGRRIAFTGFEDLYRSYQTTYLYVMDRDGENLRALTGNFDRDIKAFSWNESGDGLFIMYESEGMTVLGHVDLDGNREVLTDTLGTGATAYTFGAGFSVGKDGCYAITAAGPRHSGEIGIGRRGQSDIRLITDLNRTFLSQRTLGRLEEIRYASSKDQLPIQGWIIYPPGFDKKKKYPLILELHGAPTAYGPRFDFEKHLMAAAGYIVLYVNYRGSTTYGEDFANIIHHAYPGDEHFDLTSGVDAMIAKGNIDEKRIYIAGGSGGGVLTAWTIAHTNRFRAAASIYPITDWTSWVLAADMAADGMIYWFPGAPWESPENYAARSLLGPVANVKTPTILIVGTEDYRTPEHQSEQYYRALKWLGVDTALVRIPGASHGISRHPSQRLSKVLHVLGWFDAYK